MRVEIEISDEEAKWLSERCWTMSLGDKLRAALPRAIQVGDAVRFKRGTSYRYVVCAIVENGALLRSTHNDRGESCPDVWNAGDISTLEHWPAGAFSNGEPHD